MNSSSSAEAALTGKRVHAELTGVRVRWLVVSMLAHTFHGPGIGPRISQSQMGLLTEAFGVSLLGGLRVAFSKAAAEYMDCFNFPKLCTRILALKDPSCLKGVLKAGFWSQASVLLPKIILQDAGKGIVHFL